jgi:hypothetical protein
MGRPTKWTDRRNTNLYCQVENKKYELGKKLRPTCEALVGKKGWLFDIWSYMGNAEQFEWIIEKPETIRRAYIRARGRINSDPKLRAKALAEIEDGKKWVDLFASRPRRLSPAAQVLAQAKRRQA